MSQHAQLAHRLINDLPSYETYYDGVSEQISQAKRAFDMTSSERDALANRIALIEKELYGENLTQTLNQIPPPYYAPPPDPAAFRHKATIADFPLATHTKYPSEQPTVRYPHTSSAAHLNINTRTPIEGKTPGWRASVTVPKEFAFCTNQKSTIEIVRELTGGLSDLALEPNTRSRTSLSSAKRPLSAPALGGDHALHATSPTSTSTPHAPVSTPAPAPAPTLYKRKLQQYLCQVLTREQQELQRQFRARPLSAAVRGERLQALAARAAKEREERVRRRQEELQEMVEPFAFEYVNRPHVQPGTEDVASAGGSASPTSTDTAAQSPTQQPCTATATAPCHTRKCACRAPLRKGKPQVGGRGWSDLHQYRSHMHAPFGSSLDREARPLQLRVEEKREWRSTSGTIGTGMGMGTDSDSVSKAANAATTSVPSTPAKLPPSAAQTEDEDEEDTRWRTRLGRVPLSTTDVRMPALAQEEKERRRARKLRARMRVHVAQLPGEMAEREEERKRRARAKAEREAVIAAEMLALEGIGAGDESKKMEEHTLERERELRALRERERLWGRGRALSPHALVEHGVFGRYGGDGRQDHRPHITTTVPDYAALHAKEKEALEQRRSSHRSVRVRPFTAGEREARWTESERERVRAAVEEEKRKAWETALHTVKNKVVQVRYERQPELLEAARARKEKRLREEAEAKEKERREREKHLFVGDVRPRVLKVVQQRQGADLASANTDADEDILAPGNVRVGRARARSRSRIREKYGASAAAEAGAGTGVDRRASSRARSGSSNARLRASSAAWRAQKAEMLSRVRARPLLMEADEAQARLQRERRALLVMLESLREQGFCEWTRWFTAEERALMGVGESD